MNRCLVENTSTGALRYFADYATLTAFTASALVELGERGGGAR